MNVLHMQQILYYWRPSFSGLELHASYDWRVMTPNTHHGLFPVSCHFVCISSITRKLQVTCKSIVQQVTPLLPRMFCFMLKAAVSYSQQATAPYKHCCLVVLCTSTNDSKTQGAYDCTCTATTTFLPRLHLLEIQTEVQLRSCHPVTIPESLHYI